MNAKSKIVTTLTFEISVHDPSKLCEITQIRMDEIRDWFRRHAPDIQNLLSSFDTVNINTEAAQ